MSSRDNNYMKELTVEDVSHDEELTGSTKEIMKQLQPIRVPQTDYKHLSSRNCGSLSLPEELYQKDFNNSSIGLHSTAPSNDETVIEELDLEASNVFLSSRRHADGSSTTPRQPIKALESTFNRRARSTRPVVAPLEPTHRLCEV